MWGEEGSTGQGFPTTGRHVFPPNGKCGFLHMTHAFGSLGLLWGQLTAHSSTETDKFQTVDVTCEHRDEN